jgi:hypothetical protein
MGFYREAKEKLARLQATCITYGGKYAEAYRASSKICTIKYSTTCLKRDLGITETCLWRKDFILRIIRDPDDPNVQHLTKRNLPTTEKNLQTTMHTFTDYRNIYY